MEHTEYVRTQVITEYFRWVFKDNEDDELTGIIYPSSRNPSGGLLGVVFSKMMIAFKIIVVRKTTSDFVWRHCQYGESSFPLPKMQL